MDIVTAMQDCCSFGVVLWVLISQYTDFGYPHVLEYFQEMFSEMDCRLESDHVCASFPCKHVPETHLLPQNDHLRQAPDHDDRGSLHWCIPRSAQIQIADKGRLRFAMIPTSA